MPYIPKEQRTKIDEAIAKLPTLTPGEFNYAITRLVRQHTEDQGLSYETIKDVEGTLGCVAKEFYRRVAAEYEDIKRVENGDVY